MTWSWIGLFISLLILMGMQFYRIFFIDPLMTTRISEEDLTKTLYRAYNLVNLWKQETILGMTEKQRQEFIEVSDLLLAAIRSRRQG